MLDPFWRQLKGNRNRTEKLFPSDEIAGPHRPMVEISSASQTVFISISVTRKGRFEA